MCCGSVFVHIYAIYVTMSVQVTDGATEIDRSMCVLVQAERAA
jgi:hypothetical protein